MKYRHIKRIIAITVLLVLSINNFAFAYADSSTDVENKEISSEIQEKKKEMHDLVYEQLAAQNALELLPVYEEILYPEIEQEVYSKYNISSHASSKTYTATNGGLLQYKFDSDSETTTQVAIMGLDYDNSYYYVLSNNEFTMQDVVSNILGFVPGVGTFSSVLFTCVSIANGQANSSIKSAGGYAKVINTYSSPSGAKASVVTGWTDRFNLTVTTTGAYDVKFTAFSKTNPWE